MRLIKCVKRSLFKHWKKQGDVLLGFSGGPDSVALLHCLLELKVQPVLVHVDHGWRKESAAEALILNEKAKSLGLRFFTTRLSVPIANLEDESRKARFAFFQKIYQELDCKALLLAHHGDDVTETSLQRLFEGTHLPFLAGIQERQVLWEMQVIRPMLSISKNEILTFLKEGSISYFEDPTNLTEQFLRGRVRSFIGLIESTFKKGFRNNLSLFSARTEELREFLEKRTEKAYLARKIGSDSISWSVEGLERIEARFLLQRSVGSIPRTILEPLLDAAFEGGRGRRFLAKGMEWTVYGNRIFLKKKDLR